MWGHNLIVGAYRNPSLPVLTVHPEVTNARGAVGCKQLLGWQFLDPVPIKSASMARMRS